VGSQTTSLMSALASPHFGSCSPLSWQITAICRQRTEKGAERRQIATEQRTSRDVSRNVYVREDVGRRAENGRHPENHDQQRHDDEGIRTPERESDEAYHNCLPRWRNRVRTRRDVKTAGQIQPLLASRYMVPYTQHTNISGNVMVRPFSSLAPKQQHLMARPASPSLTRTRGPYTRSHAIGHTYLTR
jgi:hypothetical protein